jgi:hypothetical protein
MELLHIYSDGSKLYKMSALSLTRISIWKGNRIIDHEHVKNIKESINNTAYLLDSGYKIIQYDETDENYNIVKKSYLIDGQHRITVVSKYFEDINNTKDFLVTVTEIHVDSEADAIEYFNRINNVKPIQYEEDPNLIVNKYIQKLNYSFQSKYKFMSHKLQYMSKKLCQVRKLVHNKFPGMSLWMEYEAGNPEAFKEMKKYNMVDVEATEELFLKLAKGCKTKNVTDALRAYESNKNK